jgi:hypothetical protein
MRCDSALIRRAAGRGFRGKPRTNEQKRGEEEEEEDERFSTSHLLN